VIITSPLTRAKQTAEIIDKEVNAPIVVMEEFIERHFGDREGMTLEEMRSAYPDGKYPSGEETETLNKRIKEGLEKINEKYPEGKVLLVAHGGVINALLAILSNGELGYGKSKITNACFTNIHFHEKKWKIKNYNQTTHLSNYAKKVDE
jgi:uncharacterized phosphatase